MIETSADKSVTLADPSQVIAETRARRHLTQRQLAQLASVSQPWIVSVEAGKARMDIPMVLRVLAASGLRVTLQAEIQMSGVDDLRGVRRQAIDGVQSWSRCPAKEIESPVVIEVRTAKGKSLVLTTPGWTKETDAMQSIRSFAWRVLQS
jgi:transcriptional regulator with XRE-family HTH domain